MNRLTGEKLLTNTADEEIYLSGSNEGLWDALSEYHICDQSQQSLSHSTPFGHFGWHSQQPSEVLVLVAAADPYSPHYTCVSLLCLMLVSVFSLDEALKPVTY